MLSFGEQQLTRLHFQLFEQAYADAYGLAVGNSQTIREYAKVLQASATPSELIEPFNTVTSVINDSAKYYLFGDFHTLWNTQQAFLKLVSDAKEKAVGPVSIALESCRSSDQKILDQYMADDICENEFLQATHFEKNWGFPWQYYQAILDFARFHGIPVYGISPNQKGNGSLQRRDAFSAKIIKDIQTRHGGPVCCLIGELHLGDTFLPYYLSQESRQDCVRILTNQDELFFDATHRNLIGKPGFSLLGPNLYHLTNATPWYKWQTFRLWQDFHCSQSQSILEPNYFELEDGSLVEEYFDVDDFIHNLLSHLNLTFDTAANTRPEVNFTKPRRNRKHFSQYQFYPESNKIELASITIDEMIDVACQAYVFGLSKKPICSADIKSLSQAEALSRVISNIINPPQLIAAIERQPGILSTSQVLAVDLAQPIADRFQRLLAEDANHIGILKAALQHLEKDGVESLAFLQDPPPVRTLDRAS